MTSLSRRQFCTTAAAGLAGASLARAGTVSTAASRARIVGANETLRVGVIGFRSRGKSHIGGLTRLPGVRLSALCDVDRKVLETGVGKRREAGDDVEGFVDARKLLDSATPD